MVLPNMNDAIRFLLFIPILEPKNPERFVINNPPLMKAAEYEPFLETSG